MKLLSNIEDEQPDVRRAISGYSLIEVMLVGAVFTLVVVCMVSSQIFALRTYSIAEAKMVSAAGARKAEGLVRDAVRSGSASFVGNYTSFNNMTFTTNSFPDVTNGVQQGNALLVRTTTNLAPFLVFYLNVPTGELKLYDSNLQSNIILVAENIANTNIFSAENYLGQTLTNNQDNHTIRLTLQFYQRVYSVSANNNINSYYGFTVRATQR
jgi:hypothetical protein